MVIPHHLILSGLLASQVAAAALLTRRDALGVSTAFTDLAPIPPGLIDAAHHAGTLIHARALLDAEDGDYTALCALDSWRPTLLERELLESQVVIGNEVLDMPELLSRIRANRSAHGAATRQEWITRHYGATPLSVRQLPGHMDGTELACESLGHPILPGLRLVSERFPELHIAAACVQEDQGTAGEFFLTGGQILPGSAEYDLGTAHGRSLRARCLEAAQRSDREGVPRPGMRPSALNPHTSTPYTSSPQSPFFSAWTRQVAATPAGGR
ncbi:hypothetical protein Deipr_2405 (plasmid) [Deinococcus proteolyticus MRP]|uniref:Uncharacterized protein n=1 Tax=Deinococcus proteolyticus (strain ATCC 35074 / DSM 20540 / JCM 6276 / NBRC 101906 / NCIMB 13154 / VKM Ac-1939 / CCM 2703 / MRP) TaxID=693977 RepID=F0RQH0_DEIPM|nr:hypothetical protein [Deinococcus proteolyticus]ADY27529.1 hypothetical protein Deipr_2405 [Deinococcus proteolyticus MRP]